MLDPAQNHTFRDHYLDLDLDLSDVLFLATANMAEQIPGPLYDRMEVVRLDGYTEDEKVAIARDHLLARQMSARRLCSTARSWSPTPPCGRSWPAIPVRPACASLERELARLAAQGGGQGGGPGPVTVRALSVDRRRRPHVPWLGRPRHHPEVAERTSVPGVATGLAVTGVGGDVLFVEASAVGRRTGPDHHRPTR